MACIKQSLFEAYLNFLNLGCQCDELTKKACPDIKLTHKQVSVLRIIDQHGDVTFSDLARYEAISKPTVTEMISRLMERDCVYKERSQNDRRVSFIRLTEKGKKIAQAEEMTQLRLVERIEGCLTESEIHQLITLLNKLS
ncbi:MAG: MarR family winged helix-turn-helix transcriptional regulator [Eubacteriaceae bacterium]|jgi:DNA-binding MarR family transcriptional regulator|nr:MarR family winged helix-turn-helix transcriptional regulator [Eubacteriaceae bacterium]